MPAYHKVGKTPVMYTSVSLRNTTESQIATICYLAFTATRTVLAYQFQLINTIPKITIVEIGIKAGIIVYDRLHYHVTCQQNSGQ